MLRNKSCLTESLAAWKHRACIAVTLAASIAILVLLSRGFYIVSQAFELLLIGSITGFICAPMTNFLDDKGIPRAVGALISLLVVLVLLVLLGALFIGPFLDELLKLLRNVPSYFTQAQIAFTNFWRAYGSTDNTVLKSVVDSGVNFITTRGASYATDLAGQISVGLITNVSNFLAHLVTFLLGMILAYWIAVDYPRMMRELAVIAGPKNGEDVVLTLAVLSRSMGGYMRGTFITSLIDGVMVTIGLVIVQHPYAGLMGIATFIFHFVPVIGPFISGSIAAILGLFVSPLTALWTLIITAVAQNLTDNLLSPLVMRSTVKIHPALSLVGIVLGGCLGGILGMVLAIPLTAAVKSFFVYYFETHTGRQLVSEEGAIFSSTPFNAEDGKPQPLFDALDDDRFIHKSRLLSSIKKASEETEKPADYSVDELQDRAEEHDPDAPGLEPSEEPSTETRSDCS